MIYFILFVFSFALTFYIKKIAIKKSLFDIPNDRSSHVIPTPHGGGIAIAVTWFMGISYLFYVNDINSSLYHALIIGIFISMVSYFDDLYELSARFRLITQTLVAAFSLYLLGGLETVDLFFVSIENRVVTNILAMFIIVWFINLYNFLDGIDGYAGSEAVFLGFGGFLIFGGSHFLVLIVSVLGFLVWNWYRAKIFMGDVGSTLLGYNVAVFTIYYTNQEASNIWIWLILFGVFWFDATLTLIRRYKNGEKLSQAHKKHAYQRLTQSNWAHDKVVVFSILLNMLLLSIVYFISNILIAFCVSLATLYGIIKLIDYKKAF